MSGEAVRLIAFYLPQYHPIPENDKWWGNGFTEWTSVTRAKPRFRGHYQPHLPTDLGFYDLRVPETRQAQADLARQYGIHGFCYYHYWFNGKRLLERPLNEVLASAQPDFPFCICWANENWTRVWDGQDQEILIEQSYSLSDDIDHIRALMPLFQDRRYIRVGGKPLLLIYRASRLPEPQKTIDRWREEAIRRGIGDLFVCRVESVTDERGDPRPLGFDAAVDFQPRWELLGRRLRRERWWYWARRLRLAEQAYAQNSIFDYDEFVDRLIAEPLPDYPRYPCACPSWDNSSRREGRTAFLLANSTPEAYKRSLISCIRKAKPIANDSPAVFINAWNEWAEGNHLEPDQKWGMAYLEATREALRVSSLEIADHAVG